MRKMGYFGYPFSFSRNSLSVSMLDAKAVWLLFGTFWIPALASAAWWSRPGLLAVSALSDQHFITERLKLPSASSVTMRKQLIEVGCEKGGCHKETSFPRTRYPDKSATAAAPSSELQMENAGRNPPHDNRHEINPRDHGDDDQGCSIKTGPRGDRSRMVSYQAVLALQRKSVSSGFRSSTSRTLWSQECPSTWTSAMFRVWVHPIRFGQNERTVACQETSGFVHQNGRIDVNVYIVTSRRLSSFKKAYPHGSRGDRPLHLLSILQMVQRHRCKQSNIFGCLHIYLISLVEILINTERGYSSRDHCKSLFSGGVRTDPVYDPLLPVHVRRLVMHPTASPSSLPLENVKHTTTLNSPADKPAT